MRGYGYELFCSHVSQCNIQLVSRFLVVAAVGMFVVDFFDHDVQQEKARILRFLC